MICIIMICIIFILYLQILSARADKKNSVDIFLALANTKYKLYYIL